MTETEKKILLLFRQLTHRGKQQIFEICETMIAKNVDKTECVQVGHRKELNTTRICNTR